MNRAHARVLAVGGTDPLCGAGVVLDAHAISEAGVAPLVVESALVTQDSHGVRGFEPVSLAGFRARLRLALHDGAPTAIKTGVLATAAHIEVLVSELDLVDFAGFIVVDPVVAGGSGEHGALCGDDVRDGLLDLARRPRAVITPNAVELSALVGVPTIADSESLRSAAVILATQLGCAVLAKGGHLAVDAGTDWLVDDVRLTCLPPVGPDVGDLHGTGCWLASSLAAHLARGAALAAAAQAARWSLARARMRGLAIGEGRAQLVVGGTR